MEKEFIPYAEALELKKLGFNESCFRWYDERFKDTLHQDKYNTNKDLFMTDLDCSAPLYQQAFRWFREKHDLHVQIRKENYFQRGKYEYYHYDISKGEETDITNQEDLLGEIFDECSQDIPGNYLNEEKYSKLIFEKEFAFKTYEEIELYCLKQLIEIIKNK